jgi:type IV pilus assembly protein PilE
MAESRCPDCGTPVSPNAVVCPQCGFPIRPAQLPQGIGRIGGGSSSTKVVIAAVIVTVLLGGIVLIGIVAALAIPRFTAASQRAKEKQGEGLLKWAYVAEQTFHAQHGRFTGDVAELNSVNGPRVETGAHLYDLEVSAASDNELCLEAVSARGNASLKALSMDQNGSIYHVAGCSGEPYLSVPTGSGGDEGARQIMREVYESVQSYKAARGQYPTQLTDVVAKVHDSPAGEEFRVMLVHADETRGLCAAAVPRAPRSGLQAISVDESGKLYDGFTCSGTPIDDFSTSGTAVDTVSATDTLPNSKPDFVGQGVNQT